jgi:hypothetical protein
VELSGVCAAAIKGVGEAATMRNGQNKRMRGRNRKGGHHHHQNPLSRVYESNGPDVKIRGTASHVAEKYLQLARDAQSSGDPVAAENYYQHAEHYFRLIAAAQEQFRQSQPFYQQQGGQGGNVADDGYDDDDGEQPSIGGEPFAPREPQPFYPQPSQSHQQPQHGQPRSPHFQQGDEQDVERLPSFITGGQPQQQPQQGPTGNGPGGPPHNPNGPNGYDGSPDRFPLHRRRRRHRGPRDHSMQGGGENDAPMPPSGSNSSED